MSRILPPHPESLVPMGAVVPADQRPLVEPVVARDRIDPAVLAIRRRPLYERAPAIEYRHACGAMFDAVTVAFAHLIGCRRME